MKATSKSKTFGTIKTGTGQFDPRAWRTVWRPVGCQPLNRRHAILFSALIVGSLPTDLNASDGAPERSCVVAKEAVSAISACLETPNGLVLAGTQQEAAMLAEYAVAGEERFKRHFGVAPPAYGILTSTSSADTRALRSVGVSVVLPWKAAAEMQGLLIQSLRQSAETSARAQGLSAAQSAIAAEQAVARLQAAGIIAAWQKVQRGLVAHELGHLWFGSAFWPGDDMRTEPRYGSSAPDWLDEVAAILMEDEHTTQNRRRQFFQIYRGEPSIGRLRAITRDQLVNLDGFLNTEHPKFSSRAARPSNPATGAPIVSVSASTEGGDPRVLLFYLQSRMFADYVIDRTGDPTVFASIARAVSRGHSLDQWLQARGTRSALPKNSHALAVDWRTWLEAKAAREFSVSR